MLIPCPLCGLRDAREFTPKGHARFLTRPEGDWSETWHDYLHLRDNPAGETEELWYHGACGTWLIVSRNTVTHTVNSARLAWEGRDAS
ncbi:MAG: sarcosine oxidase subunit delta [Pseudomonadota bacterium]